MTEPCSTAARRRQDPMVATASRVSRWLLVEQPGPWGPPTLPTARMPAALSTALATAAAAAGARLLLLRRPGRALRPVPERHVYVVDAQPGSERLLGTVAADDTALAELALPYTGPATGWGVVDETLLLVCTHGRHDRCCAVRGRPVALELARTWPERTWECSHSGGDRFAANLLILPQGRYFGQLSAAEAVEVVRAHDEGMVPVAHLRGRSSSTLPAQAAEHFARAELGRERATDLVPAAQHGVGPDRWRVRLAGDAAPDVEVVVRYDRDVPAAQLTCAALEPKVAPTFRCESLALMEPAGRRTRS